MITPNQKQTIQQLVDSYCDDCWQHVEFGCMDRDYYGSYCHKIDSIILKIRQEYSKLNCDNERLKMFLYPHESYKVWIKHSLLK